jgi:hypothetical protein
MAVRLASEHPYASFLFVIANTPLAKSAASPVHSHEWYSTEFSDKYGTASAQKLEFMMTFSHSKRRVI